MNSEMNSIWHTVGWQEMTDELQQDGFSSVSYSPILTPARLGASSGQGPRHPPRAWHTVGAQERLKNMWLTRVGPAGTEGVRAGRASVLRAQAG